MLDTRSGHDVFPHPHPSHPQPIVKILIVSPKISDRLAV